MNECGQTLVRTTVLRTRIQFDSTAAINAQHYNCTVSSPYTAHFESAINTTPRLGRRAVDDGPGTARAEEHQLDAVPIDNNNLH
jgi:hypothetical protein